MTLPANILTEAASLEAQVAAASPLANASRATKDAIKLNAAQLVSDTEAALIAPDNVLDTWTAPVDPASIVTGIGTIVDTADTQASLAVARGVFGRSASNLDQLT